MKTLVALSHQIVEIDGSPEDFMAQVEKTVEQGGPIGFLEVTNLLTNQTTWINPIQIALVAPITD